MEPVRFTLVYLDAAWEEDSEMTLYEATGPEIVEAVQTWVKDREALQTKCAASGGCMHGHTALELEVRHG